MTELPQERRRALLALLLLAPVPSLGIVTAMVIEPGPIGNTLFLVGKIWLLGFPAFWYLVMEKGRPSWSPPHRSGLGVGALSGLGIAVSILLGAWLVGVQDIDTTQLVDAVREMRLASPLAYLGGAAAWIFVNSLMEEYVYRWFIYRQCESLVPKVPALIISAAIFTVHHVIAVSQYLDVGLTILASLGVFLGGMIWGWLYQRYRSIWPCWISHVLADVAVFGIGWVLIFG